MIPSIDFETYSEAGYYWDAATNRWRGVVPTNAGIKAVGAAVYAEHPTTEVLCLAYDLKRGHGTQLWTPGNPTPQDLFDHIQGNGLVRAWNTAFEFYIWRLVCADRMGWPRLPYEQLRCDMARARGWALPGKLENAAIVLGASEQKDKKGDLLIRRLCVPRHPTKKDLRKRRTMFDEPFDFLQLYAYCKQDVKAEDAVSAMTPDLSPYETRVWLLDQKINLTGMAIDREALDECVMLQQEAHIKYTDELRTLTGGAVQSVSEVQKIRDWLYTRGVLTWSLDKAAVTALLDRPGVPLPPDIQRVLRIRQLIGASSVKKLAAIERRLSKDGRLRDMFAYCGAERTGRWAGRGPQPHNLPNSGPLAKWDIEAVEAALAIITHGTMDLVEGLYGDATTVVSGCLRGLFCAAPGHDLICSDYSAIEAVILAFMAGEQWRMDVFNSHGLIYEASAAKITGIPFEEFIRHKQETGDHHPMRYKMGKFAELASGYQGSVGAWKAFGADKFLTDEEIQQSVHIWRDASPNIVAFWEGLQAAAMAAVRSPGRMYQYRGIEYVVEGRVLYCKLLSGRRLAYHDPQILPEMKPWGKEVMSITYMGWNSDPLKGALGWSRLSTYGGKLTENVTQATARDVLAHGMLNLDAGGYKIVLHVHDEVVSEVPKGTGSIEEFEGLMSTMPHWAADWPIKAKGGWRGHRYRKD